MDRPVKDDAQNPLNNIQLSFSDAFKQAQGSLILRNDMRLCTPKFLRMYKIKRVKFKNKVKFFLTKARVMEKINSKNVDFIL